MELLDNILYELECNHEVNRVVKGAISATVTALVTFVQADPNPFVSIIVFAVVDRARGYIFRRLNID